MTEKKSSYNQILKATSLFGGVQVFNIIISIIRSKIIAILIGPAGMGISGLLTSTSTLIGNITNLGLSTSAVKDVAAANASGSQARISIIITIFRRLVWITGLLGAVVIMALSPWLSQITFGNNNYTFAFVWLSISLLFNQLSAGQLALLQGMRKLQYLAKANISGSTLGLLITLPLYYKYHIDGIVPALILTSAITMFLSWYFARKITVEPVKVSTAQTFAEGKSMVIMGFMISLSSLITLGAAYLIRIFISHTGGIEQVGLYNAGFTIIISYVGLIFGAMGTDYYPRLSSVASSNELCKKTINQQSEVTILILAPIICIFLIFINPVIVILYSNKFILINKMMQWAAFGMYFRGVSWAIAFIFLAKGASRLFFWNELLANIYLLGLNLLGYYYAGLTGLGISFLVGYIIYFIQVFLISRIRYKFSFDPTFLRILIIHFTLLLFCFLVEVFFGKNVTYFLGSFVIFLSIGFSFIELNKRVSLTHIVSRLKNKFYPNNNLT